MTKFTIAVSTLLRQHSAWYEPSMSARTTGHSSGLRTSRTTSYTFSWMTYSSTGRSRPTTLMAADSLPSCKRSELSQILGKQNSSQRIGLWYSILFFSLLQGRFPLLSFFCLLLLPLFCLPLFSLFYLPLLPFVCLPLRDCSKAVRADGPNCRLRAPLLPILSTQP